jgi:hypothetical protein
MIEFVKTKFDDGGFTYFLQNVKGGKLKTALKSGIRKSLGIVKKEADKNLKAITFKNGSTLNATEKVLFKNKYGTPYIVAPFSKGVVIKLKKDGSKGRVEIITKDTDKNWNPILKMMEASQGERKTDGNSHTGRKQGRKAHSTGSIAHTFFTNAVKSTQTEVQRSLQKNLEDAIMKAKEKFNRK